MHKFNYVWLKGQYIRYNRERVGGGRNKKKQKKKRQISAFETTSIIFLDKHQHRKTYDSALLMEHVCSGCLASENKHILSRKLHKMQKEKYKKIICCVSANVTVAPITLQTILQLLLQPTVHKYFNHFGHQNHLSLIPS